MPDRHPLDRHVCRIIWKPDNSCSVCGFEARSGIHFQNGGMVCDVDTGPCACGAWHEKGEDR